jgi:hypothetical protein
MFAKSLDAMKAVREERAAFSLFLPSPASQETISAAGCIAAGAAMSR